MNFFLFLFSAKAYEKSIKCNEGAPDIIATNNVIDHYEFYECSEFTGSLIIPKSIKFIGNYAFFKCFGFNGTLTIPSSVVAIGNFAFAECSGFKGTLTIPNSITTIGENAFFKCSGFTNLIFETTSLQSINRNTFYKCTGFHGILTIPEYLLKISDNAFYGCSGFTGLKISNFVTEIGNGAFESCSSISGTLLIPEFIKSIGTNSFKSTNLTKIFFKGRKEPMCRGNIGFNDSQIIKVSEKYQSNNFCQNQIKIEINSDKADIALFYSITGSLLLIIVAELIIFCKLSSDSKNEKKSLLKKIDDQKKEIDDQKKEIDDQKKEIDDQKKENESLKNGIAKLKPANEKQNLKMHEPVFFDVEKIEKMKIVETIGIGAQSEVFKVSRDEYFALKILRMSKSKNKDDDNELFNKMKKFFAEFEFMHYLNHPNIIKTFGFCFGDEKHKPSILLEFCPCNLSDSVKKLTDIERITIIFEICLAMNKVHESNVIHRDLKPENILLDDNKHVKLSDFGISCLIDPETQSETRTAGVGTLLFMAPELLKNNTIYSQKVDVYSFGVVLFFILTHGNYPNISIIDVGNGKKADIPDYVNEISRQLIYNCWSLDETKRPSFAEIIEYIKSNHFKLIDSLDGEIYKIKQFLNI